MPDTAWVPAPWVVAILAQLVGVVFAAGIVWAKLTGIERRLARIETWINSSRNLHGDQLER